jgi:Transglutaminase-like superfamily
MSNAFWMQFARGSYWLTEMPRRIDIPTLRAALWAHRSLRQAHRGLRREGLAGVLLSPPPRLPATASRGVLAVLRRRPCTCLERALVLQSWHAAQGHPHEIVIGVSGTGDQFKAHAWLDGAPDDCDDSFGELVRLPAR